MSEATSVADILGKQLQKINRIQFAIKLILDSKYESELIPKLYEKYEENEKLVQKLTELKNALTKQDDICKEIKNRTSLLNKMIHRIVKDNESSKEVPVTKNIHVHFSKEKTPPPQEPKIESPRNITPMNLVSKQTKINLETLKIEKLTSDEYFKLPKYMVGRTTLPNINTFVDMINNAFAAKYDILSKGKSSLKGPDLQLYRNFKSQEIDAIKGKFFLTESDVAREQNKKNVDKISYNMLIILRHLKRITEHRVGGLVRYVYLE